ncbi:glycosyltransferase [Cyclobacterium marinum]|uniref:glycosyltransferase n=1 Tax=Cyclobacterium marinum TaxID=104 RepID=UPI0011EF978D|nr:glycosyltransferase [Cyclobacterium marinum]MBI0399145.1 glycosyltransferase [Cyclobacterium marinum]
MNSSLVTIIIPCFNHGKYLPDAIDSCLNQTYSEIEIIIVDDGSTDNTCEVTKSYPSVTYLYQKNQGLSSARNTGIKHSNGAFLVFLDADDLLLHDAIAYNIEYLKKQTKLAFVSGAHQVSTIDNIKIKTINESVVFDHFQTLLRKNYIGMHATVMFRREAFDEVLYDTTLKACEDYDIYLKIAKKHPIAHHNKVLSVYRRHQENMSNNIPFMLSTVLKVLNRQKHNLSKKDDLLALQEGKQNFTKYYHKLLFDQYKNCTNPFKYILFLFDTNFIKIIYKRFKVKLMGRFKNYKFLKNIIPLKGKRILFNLGFHKGFLPPIKKVKSGDFERLSPFSKNFGYDRGGPIDRYYIEKFLEEASDMIYGRILEIGDNDYTLRFGKEKVKTSEILHINESNPKATIIGDLSDAPQIEDNSFDCILLTQTLHLVYDYQAVIKTCHRILKPGGALLLTVPGITPIDYGEWGYTWYWSFTGQAMKKMMAEYFSKSHSKINTYGNVYAATAFLYGMGLPEIKKEMLDFHDPRMQVIVTVKAIKEK